MRDYYKKSGEQEAILIRDARYVVTEAGIVENSSLLVEDRRIKKIGKEKALRGIYKGRIETVDAKNCIVMPGLVNAHAHMGMGLLKGYAEDMPLTEWLKNKIWPAEAKLKPEHIELGAALSAAEMLMSGTTSVVSMYFYDKKGSEADAVLNSGMRGVLGHTVFDWTKEQAIKKTREFVRKFHGKDAGRIRIATSPHSAYNCSPKLLKELEQERNELNEEYGHAHRIINTLHVARSGEEAREISRKYNVYTRNGVAAYLDKLGVLKDTIGADCTYVSERDLISMRSNGASIASCPLSSLKLGSGIGSISRAITKGVNVGLGTEGSASGNLLNMFEVMKFASLLQKGINKDPTLMNARLSFDAATVNGARAMKQQNEIGTIKIGKKADIVIMSIESPHAFPIYDPYNYLVYASKNTDIKDVIVDGRLVVRDRKLLTLDLRRINKAVMAAVKEIGLYA
jgi:5-methylthioadenosine/S-adenosylhomocysteine deaminase